MGEYINLNSNRNSCVKIGSCENLCYITYDEMVRAVANGAQRHSSANLEPSSYLDASKGWWYRWPFISEKTGAARNPLTVDRIASRDCQRGLLVDVTGLPITLSHQRSTFQRKGLDGVVVSMNAPCPRRDEHATAPGPVNLLIIGEKIMPDGKLQTLVQCPVCGAICRLDELEAKLLASQCALLSAKILERDACELTPDDIAYASDLAVAGGRVSGQAMEE